MFQNMGCRNYIITMSYMTVLLLAMQTAMTIAQMVCPPACRCTFVSNNRLETDCNKGMCSICLLQITVFPLDSCAFSNDPLSTIRLHDCGIHF